MSAVRIRAVVTGRVQGVSFRYSTLTEAVRLGLAGSVRNMADGSVRVEAEGIEDAVNSFVDWLGHGPPGARVDEVVTEPLSVSGASGFEVS